MFEGKYGKVLTILLVVAIVSIVGILCFVGYEQIKKNKNEQEAAAAIEEFNRNHGITETNVEETEEPTDEEITEIPEIVEQEDNNSESGNSGSSGGGGSNYSTNGNVTYYKGFVMVGYIEIPKTGVKLPILNQVTKKSLEASVAILYPINAVLNESPNVVIAGHNYRNSSFFSNNRKLSSGDKIYITDEYGRKVAYTVYDNFEAAPEDTSFYTRNTGVREITLTTCTQDSQRRTIILARADS